MAHLLHLLAATVFILCFNSSFSQKCIPQVTPVNCNPTDTKNEAYELKRWKTYKFFARVIKGCIGSHVKYFWTVREQSTGKVLSTAQSSVISVDKYTANIDKYEILLTLEETSPRTKETESASTKCYISFIPSIPVGIIRGGSEREAEEGEAYKLDGSTSLDIDYGPGEVQKLRYKWTCTSHPELNSVLISRNFVVIPAEKSIKGTYTFELLVTTVKGKMSKVSQTVKVEKGGLNIVVQCKKNCPKGGSFYTDNHMKLIYKISCRSPVCKQYSKEQSVSWLLVDFDDQSRVQNIGSKHLMVMNEKDARQKLKPGKKYYIRSSINLPNNRYGKNDVLIHINSLTEEGKTGKCDIEPKSGEHHKTVFKVTCTDFKPHLNYLVYQKTKGTEKEGILLVSSYNPEIDVILSGTGTQVNVKIIDDANYFQLEKMTVDIKLPTNDVKAARESIEFLFGGTNNSKNFQLVASTGNMDDAMQIANILMDEINALPDSENEFKLKYKKLVLLCFDDLPLKCENDYLQVSTFASKITPKEGENVDTEFKFALSKLCKSAAQTQVKSGKRNKFVLTLGSRVKEVNHHLTKCALSSIEVPAFDTQSVTTTTPNPNLKDIVSKEEYKDYSAAQKTDKISLMSQTIANALETMELGGQAEGLTSIVEEVKKLKKKKNLDLITQMLTVGHLNNNTIYMHKWSFKLRGPLVYDTVLPDSDQVSYVGMEFKKQNNPYQFASKEMEIASTILSIDLSHVESSEKISKFSKPIIVGSEYKSALKLEWSKYVSNAPASISGDDAKEEMEQAISVHRIDMPAGSTLVLHITTQKPLLYVLVENRRPCLDDFAHAIEVNGEFKKNHLPYSHMAKRSFWWYVGILPKSSFQKHGNLRTKITKAQYSVNFQTLHCNYWDTVELKWSSQNCEVKQITDENVFCSCNHLTTFTIAEQNLFQKIDPFSLLTFHVSLVVDYTIFGCLITFLILYFILLTALSFKAQNPLKKEKITFLSDNLSNELYAYILTVKTGSLSGAGTTSNITVKIIGEDKTSKPHVLNYPDPDKKFLEAGSTNYFLLTAPYFLGHLTHLQIWSDFVGMRPAWYCQSINVYDIQADKDYMFYVNKWLSVLKNGHRQISVKVGLNEGLSQFRQYLNYAKTLIYSGHPWNIFSVSDDLTAIQKTTLCLSEILTIASLILIFIGMPYLRIADAISYGQFHFHVKVYWASTVASLISFLIHAGLRLIFRTSLIMKKSENWLWTLAWSLTITFICLNIIFLIIFGFWLSHSAALLWLLTFACALLITVIVLENIYKWVKRYTMTDIKVKVFNFKEEMGRILRDIEQQRLVLYQKFGDFILRPYLRVKYYPIQFNKYLEKKYMEETKLQINRLLKDLLNFSIYCLAIFYLVLAHRDFLMVRSHVTVKGIFALGHFGGTKLKSVKETSQIYNYLYTTILTLVHPEVWYKRWNKIDAGVMVDMCARLLGVVQIRQLRIKPQSCLIPSIMKHLNMSCEPDYSLHYDGGFDSNHVYSQRLEILKISQNVWKMNFVNETGSALYFGEYLWYPSKGYLARLGRTLKNSKYILEYLKEVQWIDYYTRAIFVEFWTYNPNHNIFAAVKIVFEKTASGFIITSHKIQPARFLITDISHQFIMIFFLLLFMIFTVRIVCMKIIVFVREPSKALRQIWNYFDLLILSLAVFCLILYIQDMIYIGKLITKLQKAKNNEYTPYGWVFAYHKVFTTMSAALVCVCVIRMWKYLNFRRMFRVMEYTLRSALVPLMFLFLSHFIIIIAYTLTGWLLLGTTHSVFNTLLESLTSVILMSVNFRNWNQIKKSDIYFGITYIYYIMVMYTTICVSNLYITILMFYYSDSQETFAAEDRPYQVETYLKDEFKYYSEFIKRRWAKKHINRLRAGASPPDEEQHDFEKKNQVFDKFGKRYVPLLRPNEHRYLNVETIDEDRFTWMNSIAIAVVRNHEKPNNTGYIMEEDVLRDMLNVTIAFLKQKISKNKQKVLFFKALCEGDIRFVSNDRIREMEFIANKILRGPNDAESIAAISVTLLPRFKYVNDMIDSFAKIFKNIKVKIIED